MKRKKSSSDAKETSGQKLSDVNADVNALKGHGHFLMCAKPLASQAFPNVCTTEPVASPSIHAEPLRVHKRC